MTTTIPLKRVITSTALVLATMTVLFVLFRLASVVLLFMVSLIVAAALRRSILGLERRRVPRSAAILLWYAVIIGLIAAGVIILGRTLQNELTFGSNTLPRLYDALLTRWKVDGAAWQQSIANRLPNTTALLQAFGESDPADVGFRLLGVTSGVVNVVISLVGILTLTFYWLADQERFERLWLTLLPVNQRAVARGTWRTIETEVGAYVRSEAAQFVLTLTLLWAGFQAVGLPYATILALYASFAQLIPWIGVPLTLLPLVALAFIAAPLPVALAAVIVIVVGLAMELLVEPYMSEGAGAHPIVVVVSLLVMADAAGLLGMIVALPLAATLQVTVLALLRASSTARDATADPEFAQLQELRGRAELLHRELPVDSDQRRALEGLLGRLDALLNRTEGIVKEQAVTNGRAATPRRRRLIFDR